jgi:hypothetical protein
MTRTEILTKARQHYNERHPGPENEADACEIEAWTDLLQAIYEKGRTDACKECIFEKDCRFCRVQTEQV